MKKIFSILTLALFTVGVNANEPDFDGYAYIMFGTESVNYKEKPSILPIESSVSATNIVQMSSGLTKVNDSFDFSIDTVATLLSGDAIEKWKATDNISTITDGTLLQENSFDISGSKLRILLHYKMTKKLRLVFGPAYTVDTFKRYNWEPKHPLIEDDTSVQEERYSSLQGDIGLAYESYMAAHKGMRFSLKALYGHPLWQETKNTKEDYKDVAFSNHEGYNADAEGYVGYTLSNGIEVGLFAGYSKQHRSGDKTTVTLEDSSVTTVEWPENDLEHLRTGLTVVWKFRE